MKKNDVLLMINSSFRKRTLPKNYVVFFSDSQDFNKKLLENYVNQMEWYELPSGDIIKNREALAYMNPKAFAWFLPAFIITSMEKYKVSDTLTHSIITCLTPPDKIDALLFKEQLNEMRKTEQYFEETDSAASFGENDLLLNLFEERSNELNALEKAAVRDYLLYIHVNYRNDFPVFGPLQALERYWAKIK